MLLSAASVQAGGHIDSGAYTVYYSAVNSLTIPAAVARDNGIERDGDIAVVTITLQKPTRERPHAAVATKVTGVAHDLLGNKQTLSFRPVESANSQYALASVAIEDGQTLTFRLQVKAVNGGTSIPLQFNQTFYTR